LLLLLLLGHSLESFDQNGMLLLSKFKLPVLHTRMHDCVRFIYVFTRIYLVTSHSDSVVDFRL